MTERGEEFSSEAVLDADFVHRLDHWGSFHRIGLSGAGGLITQLVMPEAHWVTAVCGFYFASAWLVLWIVSPTRPEPFKAWIRPGLLVADITLVSIFAYGWGTHTSPAAFMYGPIVVGFTLVPQQHLGKLALWLSLATVGGLLALEAHGLIPFAPWRLGPPLTSMPSRLFFFALLASALASVQGAVEFTVARLREHRHAIARLMAESRQREREAELASQLEEAARLEALGRLSGGVAHDFNNLLMALLGHAELARAKLDTDPAFVARALGDMERAAEHGRELTAQLLDFASRRPTSAQTIDIGHTLRDAAKLLTRLLRNSVTLELVLCPEPCIVHIDPASFERALFNLAVNASDAMPNGGVLTLRLLRELDRTPPQALVRVEDQGTGISEEDLPRIFEPFFTRKPRGKGTGLGLASVYGIVRQSQGDISVESTLGKGTIFELRFPLREQRASNAPSEPDLSVMGKGRVLLVDDNKLVLDVICAQLQSAGYDVATASSPHEALTLLEHDTRWDLLVSDIVMPGMTGVELASQIRERFPRIAILMVSGYSPEFPPEAFERLNAALLSKPFSTRQLLGAVQKALTSPA